MGALFVPSIVQYEPNLIKGPVVSPLRVAHSYSPDEMIKANTCLCSYTT